MNEVRVSESPDLAAGAPFPGDGVEECWMDFHGARMRYLRTGSGPALILLHGLMGYSFSWRYAMPALAPYRTVYALDSLGAGFSDRPKVDHSMRATALRVLQFAEKLGIQAFDLLGTSRGGAVAMCAAAECLSGGEFNGKMQVRSLILVAPVNPFSPHGQWMAPFAGTRTGAGIVRWVVEWLPWLHPYFHTRMFGDRRKVPAGSLEGYKAPLAKPGLYDHALSIVSTWTPDMRELEALLPKLAPIPAFLMWGSKDPAVYVSSLEPLARFFPHCEKVVFPGVGHLAYEECPEEFNRELIKFLKGLEARD
jgi:pimeloyl-ACP methyl ester carboxylesterase